MQCPKCKSETLVQFKVDHVDVDRCSVCDGIWFDAEELTELLGDDAKKVNALCHGSVHEELDGKKGNCPRDEADLLRVYSAINKEVILDACPECHGIWLDGGEFEKLYVVRRS